MNGEKSNAFRLKNVKIKPKLIGAFLIVGLLPLLIAVFILLRHSEAYLMDKSFEELKAVKTIKTNQIIDCFEKCAQDIDVLTQSTDIINAYKDFRDFHDLNNVGPRDSFPLTEEYYEIYDRHNKFLHHIVDTYGYHDAFILCAAHGHVMYSVCREDDLGENLQTGKLRGSGLYNVWKNVVETKEVCFTDMSLYEPSGHIPAMFMGAPILSEEGGVLAVVVFQIKPANFNKFMKERTGMGESGETYLVGSDKLMRSDFYLDSVGHSIQSSLGGTVEKNGIDTAAVQNALAGKTGAEIIIDYNGNRVLSCYSPLKLPGGPTWVIIAEIDEAEVKQPVKTLIKEASIVAVILSLIIVVFAVLMGINFSRPIKKITDITQKVAGGNLDTEIAINRNDEIGHLAAAVKNMIAILEDMKSSVINQTKEILNGNFKARSETEKFMGDFRILMEGINDLTDQFAEQTGESIATINQSLQDLSVSSKEISTTSNQQAVAVKEIVSTMEDSDKLAKGSAAKINEVVKISKKTENDVEKGFTIIQSSLDQMNQINVKNTNLMEGIKLLSQQIESIWEIVGMINSIADQTKIIAFNAELEASKSGESGKNFEIVAGEIRRLADNTVASTKDIKSKIDEIQKSSDTLILSSEEGTEKIREGLKLSNELEVVFRDILNSSEISASSAEQIALSINQQASSFEQILIALKQISEGVDNFVASTKSTTQAINALDSMLDNLNRKL